METGHLCACGSHSCPYRCPKCGSPYCSLPCYKTHSARCVAAFQSAQLAGVLHHEVVGEEEKKHMQAVLQRVHEQGAEELVDWDASARREEELLALLRAVEEDDFDETSIPAHIREEFLRDVHDGQALDLWQAWWDNGHGSSAIVDAASPLTLEVPPFAALSASPPSPELPLLLCDLLASYAFVCRRLNGDCTHAHALLQDICATLRVGKPPPSLASWRSLFVSSCTQRGGATEGQAFVALRDAQCLMKEVSHVLRALTELHGMVKGKAAQRKMIFFVSFVKSYRPDLSVFLLTLDV